MPEMTPAPSAQPDTEEVHDYAVEAEKSVEQLATGLGQMGADPGMVEACGQMADVLRKIATGLAKGMKEQEAAPAHTMDSAADEMMAERAAPAA
jgi:GTP cyclohydrolase I